MYKLSLSVHQLVDFVLRKGDLDSRIFNQETMAEGTKLHAIYQSKQGDNYLKEVPLNYSFDYQDYLIELNGRCDGIIDEETPTIDEIKTTNADLESFYLDNKEWHLGQAICYAFMYSKLKSIDIINISLTYISQINAKKLVKRFTYSALELEQKVISYIKEYIDFNNILESRRKSKEESLKSLEFPFKKLREGQNDLIEATFDSIKNRDIYFVEASTGIGKTMSTIYGALKGFKKHYIDKAFYLTPKNSGFINSFKAFDILKSKGCSISAIEIISKEKMCPNHCEKNCNPDDCPLASNYFDKIKYVLKEVLTKEDIIKSETIKKYAKANKICPFELSLDLSLYVDFIVCDYNYAFHPISILKRYFENPMMQYRMLALVDEGHNLVNRARDMYSASFDSYYFEQMRKAMRKHKEQTTVNSIIKEINKDVKAFKQFQYDEKEVFILEALDDHFISQLKKLDKNIKILKTENPKFKLEELDNFSRENYKFLKILEYYGSNYKIILKKNGNEFIITLYCLNPSMFINEKLHNFIGATIFSATLSPLDYYKNITLGRVNSPSMSLKSPFDENNLCILVNNSLSIKYKDRQKTFSEVVSEIEAFINNRVGNYIVFAPSFEYLNQLKVHFIKDERFIFQKPKMDYQEKEDFLNELEENPNSTKVAICVMGGSFSEGIDLVGDRLIGTIVIGVGMPTISIENDLLTKYYDEIGYSGFEYVYVNPGICKIMQAVGRLIRTETDIGSALLIDSRYLWKSYKPLFSSSWSNFKLIKSTSDLENELNEFNKRVIDVQNKAVSSDIEDEYKEEF